MAAANPNDVVVLNAVESPTGTATATIEEHLNFLRQSLGGIAEKLLDEGIEAKYLGISAGSTQWQVGRLKLSIEFVPEPVLKAVTPTVSTEVK